MTDAMKTGQADWTERERERECLVKHYSYYKRRDTEMGLVKRDNNG